MADPATWAIIGVTASLVGAGVSAYGQYQAGQTQKTIANFNAAQQERQAQMQLRSMQVQAALQRQQSQANFTLRAAEAKARNNNADAIDQQALAQDAINRANLRQRRDEFMRLQGDQRAAIAASGIAESVGTPLDLLAETAAKIQQDQEEQHWAGEAQRRTLFHEAAIERLGGKLALAGATLDRDSKVAEAGLRDVAAKADYLSGLRGGEIARLTGSAAARAGQYQAGATLFSGLSSVAGGVASYYPPKQKPTYKAG